MSRQPIDQVTKGNNLPPRVQVWQYTRCSKVPFSARDIAEATGIDKTVSGPYLKSLANAGYLAIVDKRLGKPIMFEFIKGPMPAPRVRPDGSPVKIGAGQENMWRSMKMLKSFSVEELAQTSTCDDVTVNSLTAKTYVFMLFRAGYLRKVSNNPDRWSLPMAKRTGPMAPMIQRIKQVYDQNLRKVVWPSYEGDQS